MMFCIALHMKLAQINLLNSTVGGIKDKGESIMCSTYCNMAKRHLQAEVMSNSEKLSL